MRYSDMQRILLAALTLWACHVCVMATPVNGSRFLFLGSGDVKQYAQDFKNMVNESPSLKKKIFAEGYSSQHLILDYYKNRYRGNDIPTHDNPLLTKLREDFDYIVILGNDDFLATKPGLYLESAYLVKDWLRWQKKKGKVVLPGVWSDQDIKTRQIMHQNLYRMGDAIDVPALPLISAWNNIMDDKSIITHNHPLYDGGEKVRLALAATLFCHYFKTSAQISKWSLPDITHKEKEKIVKYCYDSWQKALKTSQYKGEYNDSFCSPGLMNIGSNPGKDVSVIGLGTSTEALICSSFGKNKNVNQLATWGYWYKPTARFPQNLYSTVLSKQGEKGRKFIPDYLAGQNYDFAIGRWQLSETTLKKHHRKLIDESKNKKIQFVGFHIQVGRVDREGKYSPVSPNCDLINIEKFTEQNYRNTRKVRSEIGAKYAYSIPFHLALGRFVEDRYKSAPYAQGKPIYRTVHVGPHFEAWISSMLYTLATGKKAAYQQANFNKNGVTAKEWNHGVDKGYEVMMHIGSLKKANAEKGESSKMDKEG